MIQKSDAPPPIAVKAHNLGKVYRVQFRRKGFLLRDLLLGYFLPWPEQHVALQDISFVLRRGESLGLIGPNGCGKSTLLRMICGLSPTSSGTVQRQGRTVGLLELGAGLQPTLTGWQNIHLCGLAHGLTPAQIKEREQQIAEFSGLGKFLEAPIKTYSAGMTLRLGFSVAIHTNPEILVVDEVISVGDAEFQQRCFERITLLRSQGVSLVLATHSPEVVRGFCDQLIHLENGRAIEQLSGRDAIADYLDLLSGGPAPMRQALSEIAKGRSDDPLAQFSSQLDSLKASLPSLTPAEREMRVRRCGESLVQLAARHTEQQMPLLQLYTRELMTVVELIDGVTMLRLWEPLRELLISQLPTAGSLAERVDLVVELAELLQLEPGPIKITLEELRDALRAQLANGPRDLLDRLEGLEQRVLDGGLTINLLEPAGGVLASGSPLTIAVQVTCTAGDLLTLQLAVHDSKGRRIAGNDATLRVPDQTDTVVQFHCPGLSCGPGQYRLVLGVGSPDRIAQHRSALLDVRASGLTPPPTVQLSGDWRWVSCPD